VRGHLGLRRRAVGDAERTQALRGRDGHRCAGGRRATDDRPERPATRGPRASPPAPSPVSRSRPQVQVARHRRSQARSRPRRVSDGKRGGPSQGTPQEPLARRGRRVSPGPRAGCPRVSRSLTVEAAHPEGAIRPTVDSDTGPGRRPAPHVRGRHLARRQQGRVGAGARRRRPPRAAAARLLRFDPDPGHRTWVLSVLLARRQVAGLLRRQRAPQGAGGGWAVEPDLRGKSDAGRNLVRRRLDLLHPRREPAGARAGRRRRTGEPQTGVRLRAARPARGPRGAGQPRLRQRGEPPGRVDYLGGVGRRLRQGGRPERLRSALRGERSPGLRAPGIAAGRALSISSASS
jgi:hypothetical protein